MRFLVLTTLYPNKSAPHHGVFVENRLRAFRRKYQADIKVIAPVPWFPSANPIFGPYARYASVPAFEERHGLEIYHPRYFVLPKLGMNAAPRSLAQAFRSTLRDIQAKGWNPDFLDAHYLYPDGVAAVQIAKEIDAPIVLTARGSDVSQLPQFETPRRKILAALHHADAIITVADALRRELEMMGAPRQKITTLRNGVDLDIFHPADREKARKKFNVKAPVIASVGHLIDRKRHDVVIRALHHVPHAQLLIAGEGPRRKSLSVLAQESGVADRVHFLGAIAHDELRDVYNAADVLALASSREGWPNVLLEAMACGTPCVAADVWGNREVISTPQAGRLAAERSPEAFAATISSVLNDPPDRAHVRAHAEAHSWDDTADGMAALFKTLEAKSARARSLTITPVALRPASRKPKLIVTVDTEERFDWTTFQFGRDDFYDLAPTKDIDRFQQICEQAGATPLYFLSWPLLSDAETSDYYHRKAEAGLADCGLHLHPWVTPPDTGFEGEHYSFQKNYPATTHAAKLAELADAYEKAFGVRAICHRAGRYGIERDNYALLAEIGISLDFSPCPGFDFSDRGGADFSAMSNMPFIVDTPSRQITVTPVSGARALRHTRRFFSQTLNSPGLHPDRKRASFLEPMRITPENNNLGTLMALTKRLIADGVPILTFTIHSTSLTPGATSYAATEENVDRILNTIRDYLNWFANNTGDLISLDELRSLYETDARLTSL